MNTKFTRQTLTEASPVLQGTVGGVVVQIELHTSGKGRRRLEFRPYLIATGKVNHMILSQVGQIIADPHNEEPLRPVGHCWEKHLQPTARWNPDEHPDLVQMINNATGQSYPWRKLYSDGGSHYYEAANDPKMRMQVAQSSGRTMIGVLVPKVVLISHHKGAVEVTTYLQYRLVTNDGGDTNRSAKGTPQYAFGGFQLD